MIKLIPTRYDGLVELGGSTKPWKVFAIVDGKEHEAIELPYVVKLFSPENVSQQPCIAKEFIVNFLASEFDLFVPQAGVINLHDAAFMKTLEKSDAKILKKRHNGETYASLLLDGTLVSGELVDDNDDYEGKAMIFAFDFLMQNQDRGGFRNKPNLLIYREQFMLIDHELTLSFIDEFDRKSLDILLKSLFISHDLISHPYKQHIFYNALCNYTGDKNSLFNTFNEYIKNLNIHKLNLLLKRLELNNIDTKASVFLVQYLNEVKRKADEFCNLLNKLIA